MLTRLRGCLPVLVLALSGARAASLTRLDNPETGLSRWRLDLPVLHLELAQRLPDQVRGFFLARGFPSALADAFARACVFQVIARNVGERAPLVIDLAAWRVRREGEARPLPDKQTWLNSWRAAGLAPAAALAFRWATFPERQRFAPGDYNWGMLGFGPAPGESFDLQLVWREGDEPKSRWIRNLQCAEDK